MRNNLDSLRASNVRHFSTRLPAMEKLLSGSFTISASGEQPTVYLFDPNGGTRIVMLPELVSERQLVVANVGSSGTLTIVDAESVELFSLTSDEVAMLFSGFDRWVWLKTGGEGGTDNTGFSEELRVITAAGTVTVSSSEAGIAVNKAVASVTPIDLPTVASRNGKPVRVVAWANVDVSNPIEITPNVADSGGIMGEAMWELSSLGSVTLFPQPDLDGWTIE